MTEKPVFPCKIETCSKIFKAKKSLNDHLLIHKGEKPYECLFESCKKKFTQYSSLQKHERIHNGIKPYVCDEIECRLTFTQISNLKRHKRIHTNEKPFVCNHCLKKFNTTSNLKQHEKTHFSMDLRDKYECRECQKTYFHISSLKKHKKFHNKEEQIEIKNSEKKNHPIVFHKDHIDLLINGFLFFLEEDRYFNVHDLEETSENPIICKPIDPISHERDLKNLAEYYKKTIKNMNQNENLIKSEKNEDTQNPITSKDRHNNSSDNIIDSENKHINIKHQDANNLVEMNIFDQTENPDISDFKLDEILKNIKEDEDLEKFEEKNKKKVNNFCHKCNGNDEITDKNTHTHGVGCGHSIIYHKGHIDYIVEDVLHHPHHEHCDDHGRITFVVDKEP